MLSCYQVFDVARSSSGDRISPRLSLCCAQGYLFPKCRHSPSDLRVFHPLSSDSRLSAYVCHSHFVHIAFLLVNGHPTEGSRNKRTRSKKRALFIETTVTSSYEGMTRTWSRVSGCDLSIHLICYTLFKRSGVKNCRGVTVFEKKTIESRIFNMEPYGLTITSMGDAKIFRRKAETLEL